MVFQGNWFSTEDGTGEGATHWKAALHSLCFPWSWAMSLAVVQRQNMYNGQSGALLKEDRADMLIMRPGFQKF